MAFVFDFGFDSLEDPHGGREVIDSPGSFEGGGHDGDGGDEIVGEGVVEVSLKLEDILYAVEFLLVSRRKLLKSLLLVRAATASRSRAEVACTAQGEDGGRRSRSSRGGGEDGYP